MYSDLTDKDLDDLKSFETYRPKVRQFLKNRWETDRPILTFASSEPGTAEVLIKVNGPDLWLAFPNRAVQFKDLNPDKLGDVWDILHIYREYENEI